MSKPTTPNEDPKDGVELILEAYFDRYTLVAIEKIMSEWMKADKDAGRQQAIIALCAIITSDRECAVVLLDQYFPIDERVKNPKLQESFNLLDGISRHVSLEWNEERGDPLWVDCRKIYSLSDEKLNSKIKEYFKSRTIAFLSDKYPESKEMIKELERKSPSKSPPPNLLEKPH